MCVFGFAAHHMVWISYRWDILTAILEAQKQRVARQGIDMDKIQVQVSSSSSTTSQQFNWKSEHPKDGKEKSIAPCVHSV